MTRLSSSAPPVFSQPIRQVLMMVIACGCVGATVWLMRPTLMHIFASSHELSILILSVFFLGLLTCFWQVWQLVQSVKWIDAFVRDVPGTDSSAAPQILAPLAALLGPRAGRMQLSGASSRSILDSVATRIDEARDITRYLTNLLIFLGLLGTFYGLATTVPAIVETIRALAPQEGESGLEIFGKLMTGLESQLGGMGTAFSSSLLGLAGSLVIGLLELFASHGQNRFFRELEEWISSITRIGFEPGEGHDMAPLAGVLDDLSAQIGGLQMALASTEAERRTPDPDALHQALARLTARIESQEAQSVTQTQMLAAALTRIAEGQDRLASSLGTWFNPENSTPHIDAESRMRLRSMDVQLLRILEEISAGRQEAMADLRSDLAQLTQTLRRLGGEQ